MAYTFYGTGTANNPQAGDMWLNSDGSINSYYTGAMWESGGALSATQTQAALTASAGMTAKSSLPSGDNIAYESATVAYDATTGQYVNPQTQTNYGATPPAGAWVAPSDPNYKAYVNQALATTGGVTTVQNTSVNAQQSQPSSGTPAQSNTAAASSNAPVASGTTVNSGSLDNLLSGGEAWISANPLIALAGLAVIIFALTQGGGEKHARY